jgi:iron complex transport system permease protein
LLVGASLALAGTGVQGLFRNPLADPALIGVSAGAALGAVICFFFGWQSLFGGWLLPIAAFVGGWLAVLVLGLFNTVFAAGTAKLILAGVALNAMIGSVLGFFLFSASDDALRSITFWTLGSCASAQWPQVAVLLVFLGVGAFLLWRNARSLDALQLGEDQAAHLGVSVSRVRRETIMAAALLVGAATAFAGTIGFIGLIAPHMARLLLGGLHRLVLPGSLLLGAMLLVLADLGARTLAAPAELAVGILTAAIGGPFFLWLLRRPSSWSA